MLSEGVGFWKLYLTAGGLCEKPESAAKASCWAFRTSHPLLTPIL